MTDVDILPAPVLEPPPARNPLWEQEREAFYRLLPELLQTLRNRYVAIYKGRVVEDGVTVLEVAKRAYDKCGYVPIYVNLVTDQPLPRVRVPSPRSVSNGTAS